jgi:iron complex outermembrane receptor protein
MKRKLHGYTYFIFLGLLICSLKTMSQISGRVVDASGKAISFCNVVLTKATDTTLVTGSTTDVSGNFQIEIKGAGTFRLLVAYIGYKKFYSPLILLSDETKQYNAGNIVLEINTKQLNAVEVIAQKPFVEYMIDRTVYNIENSVIAAGSNGLEILKTLPGVTVSNGDAISVRGKPGLMIMIDGRTSYMSAADAASYLKSLDASQIEKIEVITNPSAKYDASGNAILNIILKKDKNYGLNVQVNAAYAQGFYNGGGSGVNANYRTKKFNFFASYHLSAIKRYNSNIQENIFSTNGIPSAVVKDNIYNIYKGVDNNGRLGMDFKINDKQTIGVIADGLIGKGTLLPTDHSEIDDANRIVDSTLYTQGTRTILASNISYDLNYKFKIDSTGKELSANADYATFFSSSNEKDITNYYYPSNQYQRIPTALKYDLPGQLTIMAAKVDYAQPLSKKTKLEGGLKASSVQNNSNAQYWNVVQGADVIDTGKTNHFIYSENIYAGYVNLSQTFSKKLEAQFGVRGENTQSKSTQALNGVVVKQNYFKLFPSAFISWKMDSVNTFNISYSRRIDRPDYGQLNPFRFFHNPYNYYIGNPYLQPQLGDSYEINHVFKNFLSTSIGYLHMTSVITNAVHYNDITHVSETTDQNLSSYNSYNMLVSVTLHPTKWWTSINSINGFHDHYFGLNQEGYYSKTAYTAIFNTLNSFNFKKNWSAEISFSYRNRNVNALMVESPIYVLDAGIKRYFGNNKGTISLNCSDILWSDRMTSTEVFQNVNYQNAFYYDSRRIRLAISWKLGRSQYEREERNKSAQEEMNRVKAK